MKTALRRQLETTGWHLLGASLGLAVLIGLAALWGRHIEDRIGHGETARVHDHRALGRVEEALHQADIAIPPHSASSTDAVQPSSKGHQQSSPPLGGGGGRGHQGGHGGEGAPGNDGSGGAEPGDAGGSGEPTSTSSGKSGEAPKAQPVLPATVEATGKAAGEVVGEAGGAVQGTVEGVGNAGCELAHSCP